MDLAAALVLMYYVTKDMIYNYSNSRKGETENGIGPRVFSVHFMSVNTEIARRSIEGERKSRVCSDRVKISEQFNSKKCS